MAYTFPVLPPSLLSGISNRGTSIIVLHPEVQISCSLVARSDPGELNGLTFSSRRKRLNAAAAGGGGGTHVVDNAPSRTSSLAASTIEIPVTCYQVLCPYSSKSLLRFKWSSS